MRRLAKPFLLLLIGVVACNGNRTTAGRDAGAPDTSAAGGQPIQTGGSKGGGGVTGSGGVSVTGGTVGTGGVQSTGGTSASGGSTASGGTGVRDASPDIAIGGDGNTAVDAGRDSNGGQGSDGAQGYCPSGWQLAWSDEFDGVAGATADSGKWVYETGNGSGGWGNSELEYYRSQNGVLDGNGNLVITAKQETVSGFNYTSARLKTQGKVTWTYGHIESRMKLPYGQGIWPAFWMLGNDISTNTWPGCGEIDVMESIGKELNKVHGTMHGPGYSGGAGPTATYTLPGSGKFADDFHVFAIEWEKDVVRWYVDGTLYSTKTPADIGSGNTWVYDKPFFILLNFAVGGQWPGNPDTTTVFPQTMTVDYVRVCQR